MNKAFWQAALIRAVRTVAQTAVGMIAVGAALSEIDWLRVLSVSAVSGLLSMLTSIATGLPEVQPDCGRVTVLAYDDYDEDGSPIVTYADCEACDLTPYVEGGDGGGDA